MPLPNQTWTTNLPATQDVVGVEQPDLQNDSIPGAADGHRVLVEHLHSLRDKAQYLATSVGDTGSLPAGCLKARVTALEGASLPSHATTHLSGGADAVKLDDLAAPDDNTDLNASAAAHGLLPKLSGTATEYLTGVGTWVAVSGGFDAHEQEFTAAVGANSFTLSATPAVNVNTLSGRNILGVFRNGIRSRYQATATLAQEYDQTAGTNKVDVTGQLGGEIFTIVYGV